MQCLVMRSHCLFTHLIVSWKWCVTVLWLFVTIATETKQNDNFHGNRTDGMVDLLPLSKDIVKFMKWVMPICPPPNNLHLLCDVTFVENHVTCDERAFVVRYCLDLLEEIYVNSDWKLCASDTNSCLDVLYLLKLKGYVTGADLPELTTKYIGDYNPSIVFTSIPTTSSHISEFTDTSRSRPFESSSSSTKVKVTPTDTGATMVTNSSVTDVPEDTSMKENEEKQLSVTYIYALIGVMVVLIEITILCFIYFYLRKKQSSAPYRRPSKESLHEEIIAPETTSPTRALVINNDVFDEEDIFKQDQKIFQSYLNLRFIDDSSVEVTPEKIIVK